MVTAAQTSQFRQANNSLVLLAQRDLRQLWGAMPLGDPRRTRNLLLATLPDLVQSYGDTAAVLGADWYDQLRNVPVSAAAFSSVLGEPPAVAQVEGSVRWAVGPLFEDAPARSFSRLEGAAQRLILQAGRDSVIGSASRDPVRTGFARIPVGETCKFCTMVASRGFVFSSAASAGQSSNFHDDCDCIILAGRDKSQFPDGYDVKVYERAFVNGEGIGRDIPVE